MIRVLIADDHTILREGVRLILESDPDLQVVGQAQDGHEAVRLARELRPDVMVMDLMMPGMDGIEASRRILAEAPGVRILVLSQMDSEPHLLRVLEAGALGYVLKGSAIEELPLAVHTVADGHVYLTPPMATLLVNRTLRQEEKPEKVLLTPREREVLQGVAKGLTNKEIADQLQVSIKTVQTHRTNLMEKLDLHDRVSLVRFALKEGLATLDDAEGG